MNIRSTFAWHDPETRSADADERAARQLAFLHRLRARVPTDQLSDAQWAVMLELFVAGRERGALNTSDLLLPAGAPLTTLLRMIDDLVNQGLVVRAKSAADRRVTTVSLSERGASLVEHVFSDRREFRA